MNNTCDSTESGMYYNINKHIRVPFPTNSRKANALNNSQTHTHTPTKNKNEHTFTVLNIKRNQRILTTYK